MCVKNEDNVIVCVYCISLYVCLSVCLSIYMYLSVCLSVSPSLSTYVVWSQQTRVHELDTGHLKVFCWDSKSVPFPINLSWWKSVIMVLNYALFIRSYYYLPPHTSPMRKSGPDVFLIFQCSGTCPTSAQGDILVSD